MLALCFCIIGGGAYWAALQTLTKGFAPRIPLGARPPNPYFYHPTPMLYMRMFVCARMLWTSEKPDGKLSSLVSQLETV